jgi:hypothetical protein
LKKGLVAPALFYLFAVPTAYLYYYVIFWVLGDALEGLVVTLVVLAAFFFAGIAIARYASGGWSLGAIGLRREGLVKSFLATSAISVVSPLLQLSIAQTQGVTAFTSELLTYPGSVNQILTSLPESLLFFLCIGLLAFGFFQAFPYQYLRERGRLLALPLVWVLWVALYGGAHIVRGLVPAIGDVFVLGLFFLIVFAWSGNSVGPILSYVLFAEEPAWVGLALLNPSAFVFSLYVKILWSFVAMVLFLGRYARRPRALV